MKNTITLAISLLFAVITLYSQVQQGTGSLFSREGSFPVDTTLVYGSAPFSQWEQDVAFDGENYLIVWTDYRSGSEEDIFGARISASGELLDPDGIYLTTNAYPQTDPCIEFNGQHYLVAWGDYRGVYAGRILPDGTVLDLNGFPISTVNSSHPKITTNGSGFFVVWDDDRNTPYAGDIFGSRIDADGNVLDVNGIPIAISGQNLKSPGVAFDGSNYLVSYGGGEGTYYGTFDLYAKRVSVDGLVIDQIPLVVCNETEEQNEPIVAFGSENCIITWLDERAGIHNANIFFSRMEPSGNLLDPSGKLASRGANMQIYSDAAFDGSNFLVVWNEYRDNGSNDIYGIRISPEGQHIEQNAFPIMTGEGFYSPPSIAFNGNYYLVVWDLMGYIYGKRISPAGVVLDADPIEIFVGASNPWVTSNNDQWLVVCDSRKLSNKEDIYCVRVSNSGSVLDPGGILVCEADNYQNYPRAVFNGSEYFVVWQDNRGDNFADYKIYGSRISPDGNVLDPGGIPISTGTEWDKLRPDLAFDGTNYMVVWHEGFWQWDSDIKARRVSADGTVLDNADIDIEIADNGQTMPRVTFDGQDFITVWQDRSNNACFTIKGARLTSTGDVVEKFNVSDGNHERAFPSIVAAPGSKVFCTYSAFEETLNDMPVNTHRIHGIFADDIFGMNEQTGSIGLDVLLYPNPTSGKFQITNSKTQTNPKFQNSKNKVEVVDLYGKSIIKWKTEPGTGHTEHDISSLPAGIYFVRIYLEDQAIVKKIIKL